MGQCNYHLLRHENVTIEAENVACAGSISQVNLFTIFTPTYAAKKVVPLHLRFTVDLEFWIGLVPLGGWRRLCLASSQLNLFIVLFQAMNFPTSVASGLPSCTKTVTVKYRQQVIKLKQNHEVVVNGMDLATIPYKVPGITVRSVSSIFLIGKRLPSIFLSYNFTLVVVVELSNGVAVWWDGLTRAYVDVPASFRGQTKVQKYELLSHAGGET